MLGNIEIPHINRNTKIPEDLSAIIYDITNVLENFGNDVKTAKRKHIKKNRKSRNTFHSVF